MDETTNQVKKKIPNPTGKGGFGDHPENRSDGRWSKNNSFTYWINYFKNLSVAEFMEWEKNNPDTDRSVAAAIAFARVAGARKDLKEFIVVAERSEGKPSQAIDVTTGGEQLDNGHKALREIAEAIRNANRDRQPNDPTASVGGLADTTSSS